MEDLDFAQAMSITGVRDRIVQVLEDLVRHVKIQPNFEMTHDLHTPLELHPEIFNSLQQLPVSLQDQYLRVRLSHYLLGLYDIPDKMGEVVPSADFASLPNQEHSAQNKALGFHSAFYQALHSHNCGQGYFDLGWLILKSTSDGLLTVQKHALTLHIHRDRHLSQADQGAKIGDLVAVHLPQNRLNNGCYVAIGDAGDSAAIASSDSPLVNLYFNLGAEGLAPLMQDLTVTLNHLKVPFTFQVPYEPENCDHPDAGTLKILKADYGKLQPILKNVYQTHASAFHLDTTLFTKQLAPGLAIAEEPIDHFIPQENFSLHRFQIVGDGFLKAWRQGEDTPDQRMNHILQSFATHQVDLNHPFLNANAEDCYLPL